MLTDVLPQCQQLRAIILDGNQLGAAGSEAFIAALPQCTTLSQLDMERCGFDETIKQALRKAWADAGKDAAKLNL